MVLNLIFLLLVRRKVFKERLFLDLRQIKILFLSLNSKFAKFKIQNIAISDNSNYHDSSR